MYLKGSKWSMTKRRKRSNPWLIILLVVAIAGLIYFDRVIVPKIPVLFVSTPTATRSPESFVSDAETLVNQGKYSLAIQAYREALGVDSKNAGYYLTVAKLEMYTAKYEDAKTDAENALLLNPNSAQAYALQGWALGFLGSYLDAEAAFSSAIKNDATIPQIYAYQAIELCLKVNEGAGELGTLDQAIAASRKAVDLDPNAMETRWARGLVLELTGNYTNAVTELEAAVTQNSNIAELHMALGRNYYAIGRLQGSMDDYNKAIEEFNRANALNPSDPNPVTYIASVYGYVGEYAKAIQYAEQAVQNAPQDPYMWGNLGRWYYRNYQYEDAILAFSFAVHGGVTKDGVEVKPLPLDYGRIAEFYYTYGLALANLGYCSEALQIAQAVTSGVRNDDVAMYNAQQVVDTCQKFADSGARTPTPLTTPTNTPQPSLTPTVLSTTVPTP
jgi:tetratricopeptide (TPR) repeat protein